MGRITFGPAEHGRPMTLAEFAAGRATPGHCYELIDGKLDVSPWPSMAASILSVWVNNRLHDYAEDHPASINIVFPKARVFVPGRPGITMTGPDGAAYRDFPLQGNIGQLRYQDFVPVLIVDVVSAESADKVFHRNPGLYLSLSAIQEYWALDARDNPNRPNLIVHAREGGRWRLATIPFGATYTTPLLPGFALLIDPHK